MAAMFDTSSTSAPEASPGCDVLASLHGVIERQDAELKFCQSGDWQSVMRDNYYSP